MTGLTVPGGQGQEPKKKATPLVGSPNAKSEDLGAKAFEMARKAETERQSKKTAESFDPLELDFLGGPGIKQSPPDGSLWDEAMMRLMKSRADVTQFGLKDDRGNVIREPIEDPDERMFEALNALESYMKSDLGPDLVMKFIGGGDLPAGYIPTDPRTIPGGVVESGETFRARQEAEARVEAGRLESPAYAAFREHVVDPLGNIVPAILQVGADVVTGALNLAGATTPEGKPLHLDVKKQLFSREGVDFLAAAAGISKPALQGLRSIGMAQGTTADEMDAIAKSRPASAVVAQGLGELVGTVTGFSAGAVGQGLNLVGKGVAVPGRALFGPAGEAIGHSVGVFGAHGFLAAQPGERLKGLAESSASGFMMGASQFATAAALRQLFRTPIGKLSIDEKNAADSLRNWGVKNKFFKEKWETDKAWDRRLTDTYIAQGMPDLPKMTGRKIAAWAIRSGGTGTGLTAIDHQFHADFIDAAINGNADKWKDVWIGFAKNYLGGALLSGPASRIVPLQRGSEMPKSGERPAPLIMEGLLRDPKAAPPRPEQAEGKGGSIETQIDPQPVPPNWYPWQARDQVLASRVDPKSKRGKGLYEEVVSDPDVPVFHPSMTGNLYRYGWDSVEVARRRGRPRADDTGEKPTEISLEGTRHSARIEGETALPSESLRKALDLPKELPAAELSAVIENSSLLSALDAKLIFNGDHLLSAEGVYGRPGVGTDPGKMFREILGEVQESPLAVPQKWKTIETPAANGRDAIAPDQKAAVGLLKTSLNQAEGLSLLDRRLLSKSIDVLDAVSARKDPAVQETLDALPELFEIGKSDQSRAIKALAESLTVKRPDIAMKDANPEATDAEVTRSEEIELREERFLEEQVREDLIREEALGEERQIVDRVTEANRDSERGSVIGPRELASEVIQTLQDPVDLAISGSRDPIAWWQKPQIDRVADMGRPVEAEMGRKSVDATKSFERDFDRAGLVEMRRTAYPFSLDELVTDGRGAYATVGAQAKDPGIRKHFGKPRQLTDKEQKWVDLHDAVTKQGHTNAKKAGVETRIDGSKLPETDGGVLTRQWSKEMRTEIRRGGGPRIERLAEWIAETQGVTLDFARDSILVPETVSRLDAVEVPRTIDTIPTHLDVPAVSGRHPQRILESNLRTHAEAMTHQNSHVMGFRSVVPRESPKAAKGKAIDATAPDILTGKEPPKDPGDGKKTRLELLEDPTLDRLPEEARTLVNRVYQESGRDAAQATARMFRALNGMPVAPISEAIGTAFRLREAGESGYKTQELLGALVTTVGKAPLLTISGALNLVEPLGNSTFFGLTTVLASYAKVSADLATGGIGATHKRLVEGGFLADTKLNRPLMEADQPIDYVINAVKKTGDVIYSPMRMSQDLAEINNALSTESAYNRMAAGKGTTNDRAALKQLKFSEDAIEAMVRGEGTEAQYTRYKQNMSGILQGGKSLKAAERSDAGLSKSFNRWVWFTNFFQVRSRLQVNLLTEMRRSVSEKDAVESFRNLWALSTFATGSAAVGIGGDLIRRMLFGNTAMQDYIRENFEQDDSNLPTKVVEMWGRGVLGGIGTPIADAFGNVFKSGGVTRAEFYKNLGRMIGPVNASLDLIDVLGHVSGLGSTPDYEGLETADAWGKYLRKIMPAARVIHEGAFGLSIIAISDKNPELHSALGSYYRWIREHRPDLSSKFDDVQQQTDEARRWRVGMKKAFDAIEKGAEFGDQDLVDALVSAELAKMLGLSKTPGSKAIRVSQLYREAQRRVASGISRRFVFPDSETTMSFTEDEMKSLYQHLGDEHVETLMNFQAILKTMARRIRGRSRIGVVTDKFREEVGR